MLGAAQFIILAVVVSEVSVDIISDVMVEQRGLKCETGGCGGGWSAVCQPGSECHHLDGADFHSKVSAMDFVIAGGCDMVVAVGDLGLDEGGWPGCGLNWGVVD